MATLGLGEGKAVTGLIDATTLLPGSWEYVGAIQNGTQYEMGSVIEASLEFNREDYFHFSASFPRIVDYVLPTRIGMRFVGQIEEINLRNINIIVGNLIGSTEQYVYAGISCDPNFFTFSCKRNYCDGRIMEAMLWKCLTSGIWALGNSDEPITAPLEVNALDDRANDFGGSAGAPLGALWVPMGSY